MGNFCSLKSEERRYDKEIRIINDLVYIKFLDYSISKTPHPDDIYVWFCFKMENYELLDYKLHIVESGSQQDRCERITEVNGKVQVYHGPYTKPEITKILDKIMPLRFENFNNKVGRNFIFFPHRRVRLMREYMREALATEIDENS